MPSSSTGDSREVASSQAGIHPRLASIVERHISHPWQQPPHPPSMRAFEATCALVGDGEDQRIILDSGCGTASSSQKLAQAHPDHLVIGVDQSASRLAKTGSDQWPWRDSNLVLVRAELTTFWRLARARGWRLERHYLLYPNPWPKSGQLMRRWHAHPVFPEMLALGGRLFLRTNWNIYAQEFASALGLVTGVEPVEMPVDEPGGLSPFEVKYSNSGHALFEVSADLDSFAASRARLI